MDAELKSYLQAMEERLDARLKASEERMDVRLKASEERMGANLKASEERMALLIANEVGILHRDMQSGFARVDERFARIDERLARIDERLDRQGSMLVNLTKAFSGLLENVERVDSAYSRLAREVTELRERIAKLEARPNAA
jgi:chromosome segregation ATPase